MKVLVRVVGAVLGVVLLLFVAAAVILPRVLKPALYESRIEALVHQKTGRTLTIHGGVSLSFFPWLGARLHQVDLSNPPGFSAGTFAALSSAEVRVKLLPLLRRRVEVSRIVLDGLKLNLVKNRRGQTNWAGLTGARAPAASPTHAVPSASPVTQALSIAGVEVSRGDLQYADRQTGQHVELADLKLTAGRIASAHAIPLQLRAQLKLAHPALTTPVTLKARLTLDPQAADIRHLRLSIAGVRLQARAHIITAPTLQLAGALTVPKSNLRALLTRLGMAPAFRDPHALTAVTVGAHFSGTPAQLTVSPLNVTLDQSHIQGHATLMLAGPTPRYQAALSIDRINIDRYRAPPAATAAPASAGAPAAATPPSALPTRALRGLHLDAGLQIARLTAFGLHLERVAAVLHAQGGLIKLAPLSAQLYGGSFAGTIQYDARSATPSVAVDEQLNGVAVGPMLRDAGVFAKFEGTGQIDGHITASGATTAAMTRALNGQAHIALEHGQIKGVNLGKIINQIEAVRAQLRGQPTGTAAPQAGDHTDFSSLTATALIQNGVVHNQDLVLAAPPLLNATGKGSVDLVHKTLSYGLAVSGQAGGRAFHVPVHVTGPFGALSWRADLQAALRGQAQRALKKQGNRLKSKLQQDLNQRLQNLLH